MCPTRADAELALIAHWIDEGECQKRQRQHFHKCPTCAHANGREPIPGEALRSPGAALRAPSDAVAPLAPVPQAAKLIAG
jgi:hypothetical protein